MQSMYSGINDLLDWLQDDRYVERKDSRELIELLEDLDDLVRAGKNGSTLDLSGLRRAAESQNEYVEKIALLALARFGDPESQHGLNRLLADRLPVVRHAAADTAGALEQAESVSALCELLGNPEEEPEIRRAAVFALGRIKHPRAAEALSGALEDSSPDIRKFAAKALANIGDAAGEPSVEPLRQALTDNLPKVRLNAVDALAKIESAAAADALADALETGDTQLRKKSALALAERKDERAISALAYLLERSTTDKPQIVRALAQYEQAEAVNALTAALDDPDSAVRHAAVDALTAIDDNAVRLKLRWHLAHEKDAAIREKVEAAAGTALAADQPAASSDTHAPAQPASARDAIAEAIESLDCRTEAVEGGRVLYVRVRRGEHPVKVAQEVEDGEAIVRITSICGPADSGNYQNALKLNATLVFGAISVEGEGWDQKFILSEAILQSNANAETLRKIIKYTADAANQIARWLEGKDQPDEA